MNAINCPVCGEPLAEAEQDRCGECGAMLSTAMLEEVRTATRAAEAPPEPVPTALPADEAEELVEAFRSQFERHQVYLPQAWTRRLERLAADAETGRRQAMVFFVDLRGYTTLSRELSEKQLDELLGWFYGVCTRQVERFGGFVIQLLGDAVFAAFGAPWAFERDAESGLQALLAIREEISRHGSFAGHPITIRAGADCGTVGVRLVKIHGQTRPDLIGSTVNLAARLQAAAETWEILISDTLADQVRGIFRMESRPKFEPKNYGREVEPWALLEHRGEAAERRRQDVPFVGRNAELARLGELADGVRAGRFAALSLTGEAGVGKTRLVKEAFARMSPAQIQALAVDCEPHYRYTLLQALLDLMRQMSRCDGDTAAATTPEAQLEALKRRAPKLADEAWPSVGYVLGVERHTQTLHALPGPTLHTQIVASLAALIEAAAAHAPLALFIDNMQWVDRMTWEVVEKLLQAQPAGLMLIATARPKLSTLESVDEGEAASKFDLTERLMAEPWEQIALMALPDSELHELLGHLLDFNELHPLVRRRLLTETEGIPLYLIELARRVRERGELPLTEELRHDYPGQISPDIPPAVIEVMQARIDNLNIQRRAILQCGAAMGRRFSERLIRLFEVIYPELLAELFALKGLAMLRDEPLPEDIQYFFTPTLLRDVAYHMITHDQQMRLHERIAELIEAHFPERLDQFAFELAVHWIRAGKWPHARRYLRRAARQAIGHGAPEEAYELVSQALQSFTGGETPPEGQLSPQALLDLQQRGLLEQLGGVAGRLLGQYNQSDNHFTRFLEIAQTIGNEQWLHDAFYELAGNAMEKGELANAEELLDHIPAVDGETARQYRVHNLRGIIRLRTAAFDGALEEFRAVAEQIQEESATVADAWNNMGLVLWQQGRLDQAQAAFDRALNVWRRIGQPFGEVISRSNLGIIAEKQGRIAEAEGHYAEALVKADELGYLHMISAIEANLANLTLLRRQWKQAEGHAARSLHAARMIGHRHSEAIALENLGLALSGQGLRAEAREQLRQAEALGESMGDPTRCDSPRLAQAWNALQINELEECRLWLGRLGEKLDADLADWSQTIQLALEAQRRGEGSAIRDALEADPWRRQATLEQVLRRIDAMAWLAARGIDGLDAGRLEQMRNEQFLTSAPE